MHHPLITALRTRGHSLARGHSIRNRLQGWSIVTVVTVVTVAAVGTTLACRDGDPTGPNLSGVQRSSVTGEAASAIGSDGLFIMTHRTSRGEINEADAVRLAAAFWHDNARFLLSVVERDRGSTIADELRPCPRAFYARSAYDAVPANAPAAFRKVVGSHWIVGMCEGSAQQVAIAVSVAATDAVVGSGEVRLHHPGNANFFVMGVPVGAQIPMTPESIADFTAKRTSMRLSMVPELVMRPYPNSPLVALWQVTLEAAVRVKGVSTKSSRDREVLFAGPANGWIAPALADARADIPEDETLDATEFLNSSGELNQLKLNLRRGVPRRAELAIVEGR